MKISMPSTLPKKKTFGDLQIGDVFMLKDATVSESSVLMKVCETILLDTSRGAGSRNALYVKFSSLLCVLDHAEVIHFPDAKLELGKPSGF